MYFEDERWLDAESAFLKAAETPAIFQGIHEQALVGAAMSAAAHYVHNGNEKKDLLRAAEHAPDRCRVVGTDRMDLRPSPGRATACSPEWPQQPLWWSVPRLCLQCEG